MTDLEAGQFLSNNSSSTDVDEESESKNIERKIEFVVNDGEPETSTVEKTSSSKLVELSLKLIIIIPLQDLVMF